MTTVDVQKFHGGRAWMTRALVLGLLGLGATLGWMAGTDTKTALFSYLVAFCYWAGLGLGALILTMIFHAFHAKWMTILRRPIEVMAWTLVIFAVLFLPIALGLKHLYLWWQHDPLPPGLTIEQQHLMHHKAGWLNSKFFIIRTFIYLAAAIVLAFRFFSLSTRQDRSGDPAEVLVKMRRLSAGALPLMAIVFAFTAFDWMMTLDPFWFSTIFGVYYFAGSFLTVISLLVLVTVNARGKDLFGGYVTSEHTHNLGKLMLAFTAFWGYIGFSQFMLIWIAGLPEEIPFYTVRMTGGWAVVGLILIFGHFFLPFFTLLSKNLKRKPKRLAVVAGYILFIHFIDLYWLIIPTLSPQSPTFHWTLITAWVGIGGIAVAAAIWRARGHYTVPVRDPFLSTSLSYRQP